MLPPIPSVAEIIGNIFTTPNVKMDSKLIAAAEPKFRIYNNNKGKGCL